MTDAARAKADEMARALFTDGQGRHAEHLVLQYHGQRGGTGWGEAVVASRLAEALDAFAATETARAERAEAQVERLRAAASRVMAIADRDHEAFVALRVLLADPPSGAPR